MSSGSRETEDLRNIEAQLVATSALEIASTTEPADADAVRLVSHAVTILLGGAIKLSQAAQLSDVEALVTAIRTLWKTKYLGANSSGGSA